MNSFATWPTNSPPRGSNGSAGFEGETIAFKDGVQRLYTDDGNGDGRLAYRLPNGMNVFQMIESVVGTITDTNPKNSPLANPALAILAMPATNFVVASRKDMIETYEALTDHVRGEIETPLWQQQKNSSLDSELRALKDNPISRVRYLFLDMLMPASLITCETESSCPTARGTACFSALHWSCTIGSIRSGRRRWRICRLIFCRKCQSIGFRESRCTSRS